MQHVIAHRKRVHCHTPKEETLSEAKLMTEGMPRKISSAVVPEEKIFSATCFIVSIAYINARVERDLISIHAPKRVQGPNITSVRFARSPHRRCRGGMTSTPPARQGCCPRRARRSRSPEEQAPRRTQKRSYCRTHMSLPDHHLSSASYKGARCRGCKLHRVPVGTGGGGTGGGAERCTWAVVSCWGCLRNGIYKQVKGRKYGILRVVVMLLVDSFSTALSQPCALQPVSTPTRCDILGVVGGKEEKKPRTKT